MLRMSGWLVVGVLVLSLAMPYAPGMAEAAYPERDITLLVPWPAGGGTDTLARTLAKNAKKYFGVTMVVVNKVGGDIQAGRVHRRGHYRLLEPVWASGYLRAVLPGFRASRSAEQEPGRHLRADGLAIQEPERHARVRQE